jgi:hypothetical protein
MSRFEFNQPYQFEGLEPQQIRDDFADYMIESCQNLDDAEKLIYALVSQLSTDKVGQFLDDRMMGRV